MGINIWKIGKLLVKFALIYNGKRTATVIAIEKCELYALNGITFREILK